MDRSYPRRISNQEQDLSHHSSHSNTTPHEREVGVLIVDDQPAFRHLAHQVIDLVSGLRVAAEAASGEEAVEIAHSEDIQAVIMDVYLPGMSGLEASHRIVDQHAGVAVLLVSSYRLTDIGHQVDLAGAVGFLRKEELEPTRLRDIFLGP